MARRKLEERYVRKLTKTGGSSVSVTLPIELVRKLGWKIKQKVVAKETSKGILIVDWEE